MRARDIEVLIELEKLVEQRRQSEQRQTTAPPSKASSDEPKPAPRTFELGWRTWCEQPGKN